MRDEHIIQMLEREPLSDLNESELAAVRAHAEGCRACGRAYEAARLSELMLRERAAQAFEPSPFFQTRVMAALRERRAGKESWSLVRLWKAAGALVSSMAVTVAALVLLTFTAPSAPTTQEAADLMPDEAALFVVQEEAEEEIDYEQLLTNIYGAEDARVDDGQNR